DLTQFFNGEVLGILYFFVNDVYPRFPYKYSVTSFILNASLYLAIKTPPKVRFITLTSGGRYPNGFLIFYLYCCFFFDLLFIVQRIFIQITYNTGSDYS